MWIGAFQWWSKQWEPRSAWAMRYRFTFSVRTDLFLLTYYETRKRADFSISNRGICMLGSIFFFFFKRSDKWCRDSLIFYPQCSGRAQDLGAILCNFGWIQGSWCNLGLSGTWSLRMPAVRGKKLPKKSVMWMFVCYVYLSGLFDCLFDLFTCPCTYM